MFASLTNVRENWVGREVSGEEVGGKLCGEGNADGSKEEGGGSEADPRRDLAIVLCKSTV